MKLHGRLFSIMGFIAVVLATLNVVGGFAITDRMLKMFKKNRKIKPANRDREKQNFMDLLLQYSWDIAIIAVIYIRDQSFQDTSRCPDR
jgi:hypothetical protein